MSKFKTGDLIVAHGEIFEFHGYRLNTNHTIAVDENGRDTIIADAESWYRLATEEDIVTNLSQKLRRDLIANYAENL